MTPTDFQAENTRRLALYNTPYDPITGLGATGPRKPVKIGSRQLYLPESMLTDAHFSTTLSPADLDMLRFMHDFEFWAATCVNITHKLTGQIQPFILNRAQRHLLEAIETQRRRCRPLRIILLKARQWGGSTLIQIYFAWIQIIHRQNFNSLICAHVKDTAATIRGMYSLLLDQYPTHQWPGEGKPSLRPFEGSANTRVINGCGACITLASCDNQDAARGHNYSLAHLSEVAFWKQSQRHTPTSLVRAICSGIALEPYTFVALESTANGVGNYFHSEWLRAVKGLSDKTPVFVPWHMIDIYSLPLSEHPNDFAATLTDYELSLWHAGATLQAINWYRHKLRETGQHHLMMAEYPSTPDEAFASSANAVFATQSVERLRQNCTDPTPVTIAGNTPTGPGALVNVGLRDNTDPDRIVQLWDLPDRHAHRSDYIVTVDIGGRSASADYSVVAVIDRRSTPKVVAQWRGHIDHDLLAWHAAAIARFYRNALLVFESNTLESTDDHSAFILDSLYRHYPNLYTRPCTDGSQRRLGYHTNRASKTAAIDGLIAAVRDGTFIERSSQACDELLQYQRLPGGVYAAQPGCHDDILMTRAIALHVIAQLRPTLSDQTLSDIRRHNARPFI